MINSLALREAIFNVRNIVSSQAVLSTVNSQVNNEVLNFNFATAEMSGFRYHPELELLYLGTAVISVYLQYKYFSYIENKWKNVETYSSTQKITNKILLILMIVFTKNVENAI
jgi:predicted transcriptional regulator with HTH domain